MSKYVIIWQKFVGPSTSQGCKKLPLNPIDLEMVPKLPGCSNCRVTKHWNILPSLLDAKHTIKTSYSLHFSSKEYQYIQNKVIILTGYVLAIAIISENEIEKVTVCFHIEIDINSLMISFTIFLLYIPNKNYYFS